MWSPGGTVVTNLPDDVSSPNSVPLLYFNLSDVGVSDSDALLLVLKDNEARLAVPVHVSRLVDTVRPGYLNDPTFKRGQHVLSPSMPVFVLFSGASKLVGPTNAVFPNLHHGEVPGELIRQAELRAVGMLSGVEVHPPARNANRWVNKHRLGQGVVFDVESSLGTGLARREEETGQGNAEGTEEAYRKPIHCRSIHRRSGFISGYRR